jgi:hypothetical protein
MEKETITAIFLGIGLSASCGFRVFVPLLIASIAARLGFLPVNESFAWLSTNTAIACFAAATILEIIAYYIPFVDNLLDTIATPLAIGAGTLLTASIFPVDSDLLKWVMALIIGGGAAAAVQGGTSVVRLTSSGTTGGLGNFAVSSGENLAAVGTPILSMIVPLLIGLFFIIIIIWLMIWIIRKRKRTS